MCVLKPLANNIVIQMNKYFYVATIWKYYGFIKHMSILIARRNGLFTLVTTIFSDVIKNRKTSI